MSDELYWTLLLHRVYIVALVVVVGLLSFVVLSLRERLRRVERQIEHGRAKLDVIVAYVDEKVGQLHHLPRDIDDADAWKYGGVEEED